MKRVVSASNLAVTGMDLEEQSFTWRIENFHLIRKSPEMINSQKIPFTAGDTLGHSSKWMVYLKHRVVVGEKWIAIFHTVEQPATRAETWGKCYAQMKVLIKDKEGKDLYNNETKINDIPSYGDNKGFPKVIEYESYCCPFKDPNLIIDIDFKLYAPSELRITPKTFQTTEAELKANFALNFRNDLASLLRNPIPCHDIKFITNDDKEWTVQKGILAVRSPVFEAMLRTDMTEASGGTIQLPDISSKGLRTLLHFIYTGELLPEWSQPDVIVELTNAAAKYQLKDLLHFLNLTMGKMCVLENALALMALANQLSMTTAQADLLEFIKKKGVSSPDVFCKMLEGTPAPEEKYVVDVGCQYHYVEEEEVKSEPEPEKRSRVRSVLARFRSKKKVK